MRYFAPLSMTELGIIRNFFPFRRTLLNRRNKVESSETACRMAEVRRGVDSLFNFNSLSSPYVVGGPKSLISRRGNYLSLKFLIEILRFAQYDEI